MKSLGKMVVIAQGIFDLRVLYQEKIRFEKCAQKVGILKKKFHKLVSFVPNIILFHYEYIQKYINWFNKAVLSTDYDDVSIFCLKNTEIYEKRVLKLDKN